VDFSLQQVRDLVENRKFIHPDIADAVYKTAVFSDSRVFPGLIKRFEASDSEQERMIISAALGCVQPELLQEVVDYALDKIPPRLSFVPLSVMSSNPALIPYLWKTFKSNRDRLETLAPVFFERVLIGIISMGGLANPQELKAFFSAYAPESMKTYQQHLQETVDMSLEMLEALLKLRRVGEDPILP
jgi:hypothetical protein